MDGLLKHAEGPLPFLPPAWEGASTRLTNK